MMVIKKALFITSMADYDTFPDKGLMQIAIVGRSNIGKSSLINTLLNRRELAKTSSTPGKTRLINIYNVNDVFHLVDLPGYGFAKVSKAEKSKWNDMMNRYFSRSAELAHVLHLVDIRHDPSSDDVTMNRFLRQTGIPFTVVMTKADKLSRNQCKRNMLSILFKLETQPWQGIVFSSIDGRGRNELLEVLQNITKNGERTS